MTVEKVLNIFLEEFSNYVEECKGFDNEFYKNYPVYKVDKSIGDF